MGKKTTTTKKTPAVKHANTSRSFLKIALHILPKATINMLVLYSKAAAMLKTLRNINISGSRAAEGLVKGGLVEGWCRVG